MKRINRRVLQTGLKVFFRLRYSQRHAHLCLEKVNGLNLLVLPQIFNPTLFGSSLFLANYLRQHPPPSASCTLDLGCGSGLLGLTLALTGAKVVATDLNPEAVWVSEVNAHLNGCANHYEVRQGSLYQPVSGEQFDLIVMNPPYYAHTPTSLLEQAFMAGPDLETLRGMLMGAATYLTPTGHALAVLSSTIPMTNVLAQVAQAGLEWQIVARRRFWAEWHLIYQFRLARHGC
jgi:methylase of polypeptide subunit release factors